MSVTIINSLQEFAPSNNSYYILMGSASASTLAGYEYIVDIYNDNVLYDRKFLPPLSTESWRGKTNLSSSFINAFSGSPITIPFSSITTNNFQMEKFDLKIGEQYYYYWNFTDNFYNSNLTAYTGNLGFTSSTNTHQYEVGDYVYIEQNAGYTEENYNGVFEVVFVPDTHSIVVNYPFTTSTPVNPGTSRYQDWRKIQYTGQTTSAVTIWRGVIDSTFNTYNWLSAVTETNAQPLTILPRYQSGSTISGNNDYKVNLNNNGFFNIYVNDKVQSFVITKDDSTQKTITGFTTTSSYPILLRFPYAPASINSNLGYNWISGDTEYYSLKIYNTGGTNILESYYIDIIDDCGRKQEIVFEDSMGSYICVNVFITKESIGSNKSTYKMPLSYGLDSSNNYTYDSRLGGETIYNVNTEEVYVANTGWIGEDMVPIFENLIITATKVYIKSGDSYLPIVITTNNFDRKYRKYKSTRLIDYTFSFKKANTNNIKI